MITVSLPSLKLLEAAIMKSPTCTCIGAPNTSPMFWDLLEVLTECSRPSAVLTPKIYYSNTVGIHSQMDHMGKKTHAEYVQASFCSLPPTAHFSPSSKNGATCVWCLRPRKTIKDSLPKVLMGSWSHRHPLTSMNQNSFQKENKCLGKAFACTV